MPGPISRMDHRCEDRGCAANARANGSPSAQPGSNARDEAWEPNLVLQYRVTKGGNAGHHEPPDDPRRIAASKLEEGQDARSECRKA